MSSGLGAYLSLPNSDVSNFIASIGPPAGNYAVPKFAQSRII